MKKNTGFTLIELLIVIAILGIIVAVGLPSYNSYMTKSRRVEAHTMLIEIAGEQQRYFSENNNYAENLTDIGYQGNTVKTESGYYSISVSDFDEDTFSYTLEAVRVVGSAQENDADCGDLSINSVGAKGITGKSSVADCW